MCLAGLPIAVVPLWQDAHGPCAVAWLNFAEPVDNAGAFAAKPGLPCRIVGTAFGGPAGGVPNVGACALRMTLFGVNPSFCATDAAGPVAVGETEVPTFAAPPNPSGATFAKFDVFAPLADGVEAVADGVEAVADGANACVDTGLLLKRMFALALGEAVGVPTGVVLADRAELVAAAAGLVVGALAEDCELLEFVDGITEVIAAIVLVTTVCIIDLTAAIVVGAAINDLAVVTQPAAGCWVPLQLVNDVAACTWQQPQSCDFAP
jgi:hypothetical protein